MKIDYVSEISVGSHSAVGIQFLVVIKLLTTLGLQPSATNFSFSSSVPVDLDMPLASGTAHILPQQKSQLICRTDKQLDEAS